MTFQRRVRVVNRVDELVKTLSTAFDEEAIESTLEESARIEASRFLNVLRQSAPVGQVEPVREERPSIRLHGITLDEGWREPQIIRTPKGVHFKISNIAPHLKILRSGAIGHTIPELELPYPLAYWWGSPLRWPARGGYPGMRFKMEVHHPGFKPFNFIQNAIRRKEGRETIKENFEKNFKTLLNPLGTFFNK